MLDDAYRIRMQAAAQRGGDIPDTAATSHVDPDADADRQSQPKEAPATPELGRRAPQHPSAVDVPVSPYHQDDDADDEMPPGQPAPADDEIWASVPDPAPKEGRGRSISRSKSPPLGQDLQKEISDATDPLGATPVPRTLPTSLGPKWVRPAAATTSRADPVAKPVAQTPAPDDEEDDAMQPLRRTRDEAERQGVRQSPSAPNRRWTTT